MSPKPKQIQEISADTKQYQELLNEDGKERFEFIHDLVTKVVILKGAIQITINPNALFEDLPLLIEPVTVQTPAKIERCGMAMRFMVGNKMINQKLDTNLIQTIRNGQDWLEKLTSGKVKSMAELSTELGLTNRAITNMLYRAFLAPDIVRSIMNGTQPSHLTGDFLKRHTSLPLDWKDQRKFWVLSRQGFLSIARPKGSVDLG